MNAHLSPKLALGFYLWLVGMLGVIPLTLVVIPQLLAGKILRQPLWAIEAISGMQSAILLALTVWTGVALAGRVGLSAPVFQALAARGAFWTAFRHQLVPGTLGGLVGGAILVLCAHGTPEKLVQAKQMFDIPLLVRVLYGGFTEELLLRWGVMSLLLWLCWKGFSRAGEVPALTWVWLAIAGSALLFAIGHLPTAAKLAGDLTTEIVVYVLSGNLAFGLMAGWLFWRYGLESAMLYHAIAHVVAVSMNANP